MPPMPPPQLLSFDLTTSASALPLQTLGARYGFLPLHWVVTERFTHHPPAPKAPQDLARITGVLQVTDADAFQEALTRRIGRHTYARHPIPTIGALYVASTENAAVLPGLRAFSRPRSSPARAPEQGPPPPHQDPQPQQNQARTAT